MLRPIFVASEPALTWGITAEDNEKRMSVTQVPNPFTEVEAEGAE